MKREETKPPAAEAAAATENDAPKPKKMVVRFGCKPAKKPAGERARGAAGVEAADRSAADRSPGPTPLPARPLAPASAAPRRSAPYPPSGGVGPVAAAATPGAAAAPAPAPPPRQSPSARDVGGARIPTPHSRLSRCPSRVTRSSRGYGLTPLGRSPPRATSKTKTSRSAADAAERDDDAATSGESSREVFGAGVFGPGVDVDVTFVASQPGAGSTMLLRRNRHLAGGAWLDPKDAWTSADAAASRRLGPPPVRVNPNDPNMVLRTYFPEPASGSPLQGARSLPHPWNAALASTRPGSAKNRRRGGSRRVPQHLPGRGRRGDGRGRSPRGREGGKKDKGLVGRPGRVESVYNASVVGGSPTFLPSSHVKCFPKPPPMFAPPPYAHRHQMGLALGFKAAGGDDKFQVAIKSLTTDSETLKISARPGDTVETLLRRVRKKWTDVRGRLEAYFPEGEHGKAHVAACEAAKAEGRDPPRATAWTSARRWSSAG